MNKKVILMILDGWGKSPDPKVSAIDNANTPFIDSLYNKYPNAQLRTDGLNVGLPEGQMGNSEVGHMNLGAGRIVYQDLEKINIDSFWVADFEEGVILRKNGIIKPIIVANTSPKSIKQVIKYKLDVVVYNFRLLDILIKFSSS